jgi:hypothetical protein
MLNRALCIVPKQQYSQLDSHVHGRAAICGVERSDSPKSSAHLFLQRAAVCLDADERERTMQDSDTALAFEARQQDAPVLRVAAQTY